MGLDNGLGTNTKSADALGEDKGRDVKRLRNNRRKEAARLLPGERCSWCGQMLRPKTSIVSVFKGERGAHVKGVAVCGSVWVCPCCASRITERRRVELEALADEGKKRGYTPIMTTETLQHNRDDQLTDLLKVLLDSVKSMKATRQWKGIKKRYGLVWSVSALENMTSREAGHHPHLHNALWSSLPVEKIDVDALKAEIYTLFGVQLAKRGGYASSIYGVDVRLGDEALGEYVSKWGIVEEVTKSPVKNGKNGHYSPFQLLDLSSQGDKWASAMFVEYARAMKGRRQLTFSKDTKKALDEIGVETLDDERIAQTAEVETAEDVLVFCIAYDAWKALCRADAVLEMLFAVEDGREVDFLARHEIEIDPDGIAQLIHPMEVRNGKTKAPTW